MDFGTVFTSNKFTFQVSISNLKKVINATSNNLSDQMYYSSASYKIQSKKDNDWAIEPTIAYSKSDFYADRIDAGLRLSLLNEQFSVIGIYRSDKIIATGIAFKVMPHVILQGAYQSGISNSFSNSGMVDLALRINLNGKSERK